MNFFLFCAKYFYLDFGVRTDIWMDKVLLLLLLIAIVYGLLTYVEEALLNDIVKYFATKNINENIRLISQ